MKYRYYAAFVPGAQNIVEEIVKARLEDIIIKKLLDGAMIFETDCSYDRLNLPCFNNVFSLLDIFEGRGGGGLGKNPIESHIKRILGGKNFGFDIPANTMADSPRAKSFRVIFSHANRLVPVDENLRGAMERFIAEKTGHVPDRSRPDTEYWFLYRSEGFSVFMERRSRHRPFDKILRPGELIPQLAYMMCALSRPTKTDIVLDPFCGYGSIVEQRVKNFPLEKFHAFDINNEVLKTAGRKIKGGRQNLCDIRKVDIFNILPMAVLGEKSVDKIITDPPWGMFEETSIPLWQFYDRMVDSFCRVLKDDGIAVILTARKEELTAAVEKARPLVITASHHILVSGKKAGLFTLAKNDAFPV